VVSLEPIASLFLLAAIPVAATAAPPGSNHTFRGFAGTSDRFQNRVQAHTVSRSTETPMPGNRNILYLLIGALIVAVGVLSYNLYQTKKEPEGLQINFGPNGLKIQNK
jgi:hypothetical protein